MLHTDEPQRIRLTQEGFENYTGQMGILFFEDGLSTHPVPFKDANRMSAVMVCEFEDGTSCNPAQRLLDTANQSHDQGRETTDQPPAEEPVVIAPVEEPVVITLTPAVDENAPARPTVVYSRDELADIADKKGIAGLREIATPLGIKSNSITGLIEELVKATAAQ